MLTFLARVAKDYACKYFGPMIFALAQSARVTEGFGKQMGIGLL